MNFLIVYDTGTIALEPNVSALPARMAKGNCRSFIVDSDDTQTPFIGAEIFIGEGELVAETLRYPVLANGVEVGSGQHKKPIDP